MTHPSISAPGITPTPGRQPSRFDALIASAFSAVTVVASAFMTFAQLAL